MNTKSELRNKGLSEESFFPFLASLVLPVATLSKSARPFLPIQAHFPFVHETAFVSEMARGL